MIVGTDHCCDELFPSGRSARADLLSRCAASVIEALRASVHPVWGEILQRAHDAHRDGE
jgi:hypothetical protein